MSLQTAIVVFPGSNRERDAAMALSAPPVKHHIWSARRQRNAESGPDRAARTVFPTAIICAPALWRPIRRSMREVKARAKKARGFWGICNGFQNYASADCCKASLLR